MLNFFNITLIQYIYHGLYSLIYINYLQNFYTSFYEIGYYFLPFIIEFLVRCDHNTRANILTNVMQITSSLLQVLVVFLQLKLYLLQTLPIFLKNVIIFFKTIFFCAIEIVIITNNYIISPISYFFENIKPNYEYVDRCKLILQEIENLKERGRAKELEKLKQAELLKEIEILKEIERLHESERLHEIERLHVIERLHQKPKRNQIKVFIPNFCKVKSLKPQYEKASDLGLKKKTIRDDCFELEIWLKENQDHYPSKETKLELARKTTLTYNQVQRWFQNSRVKFNKPKII